MKRIIFLILILCLLNGKEVYGKEESRNVYKDVINQELETSEDISIISMEDFEFNATKKVLNESGYENINIKEVINNLVNGNILTILSDLLKTAYKKTVGTDSDIFKLLWQLTLTVIISCFFTNFAKVFSKDDVSETAFFICYLVSITFMFGIFNAVCNIAGDFISLLIKFMYGIIPTYFLSVAIVGQVSASGFYQLCLIIISVSEFLFLHIIIPLIKIYVTINIINNISKEDFLSKTATVIKNVINFLMKSFVGIVTGLNIIQALILPAVDSTKNTTVRKVIGSIPVIGGSTDAISGILLGSANLIKNTIGSFAIIIIVLLCLVPFIKIQIYSFSMQLATAVLQPVADKRIIDSFSSISIGMKMLVKVITGGSLLFIISIAIICMVTGKG